MDKLSAVVLLLILAGCGGRAAPRELVVTPNCSRPAPLENASDRADPGAYVDEYVVLLREGSDVSAEGRRLARKHGFAVAETFTLIPAFAAGLDPPTVAALRCEPAVQSVEFSRTNVPPPA